MSISVQAQNKELETSAHLWNGAADHAPALSNFLSENDAHEPSSQDGLRVSEEEYWQFYYRHLDFNYEWNNGILEEKPMSKPVAAEQYQFFFLLVKSYAESHPNIRILNLEIGFRLPLSEKTTIRKPDLFIVLGDNPVPLHPDDATFAGIGDVCVESLSDSNQKQINRDVIDKRDEYAEAGVREYYILDPDGRYTTFYQQTVDPQTGRRSFELLPVSPGGIVRSQVMPGFQFRVRDLYRMPPMEALAEDEVYRGYVWLSYQSQKQRAEMAEVRAERAEERVGQERTRAEEAEERVEQERMRAKEAEERVEQERIRAEEATALANKYEAMLRQLGMLSDESKSPD